MPVKAFFAVNIAGTVARLWLVRRFGEAFEAPIDDVVGWIGEYRLPLLALSISLVVLSIFLEAKKGETEVESLAHLEEELEGARRGAPRRPSVRAAPPTRTERPAHQRGSDAPAL